MNEREREINIFDGKKENHFFRECFEIENRRAKLWEIYEKTWIKNEEEEEEKNHNLKCVCLRLFCISNAFTGA